MFESIVMTRDGFEITGFSRESLASLGALFFLRFTGYTQQPGTKKIIKEYPHKLQHHITKLHIRYQKLISKRYHLSGRFENVEVFLTQSLFSPHKELTLNINVAKNDFLHAKRILYTL